MEEIKVLLKELVDTPAIAGFESGIRNKITDHIVEACDELWEDSFGNLIAKIGKNNNYKIGIYAHMDEVGLIVRKITGIGLIYFELMGMIDEKILPGLQVDLISKDGTPITGVIGNKSKHLQTDEDMKNGISYKTLVIDVGARSAQEVYDMGVDVGSQIVFKDNCTFYENETVMSKALDDRLGCLTLIHVLRELSNKLENITLYGFFTAQEEIGAKGASVVADGMNLDMFICLDTCPVLTGTDITEGDVDLNGGPVIRLIDSMPAFTKGMISNPEIVKRLRSVAEQNEIAYQADVLHSTYLDSSMAQLTDNGIPGGSICFPRRYSHTPIEMSSMNDVVKAIELLCKTIESIDETPIIFGKKIK